MPSIVGGLDIHRKQITFDYLDTDTGEVSCGQIAPAERAQLRNWLAGRFDRPEQVAFAVEASTGWRYVAEELAAAGIEVHLAEPADTATLRGKKKRAKRRPGLSRPQPRRGAGRADRAGPRLPVAGRTGPGHAVPADDRGDRQRAGCPAPAANQDGAPVPRRPHAHRVDLRCRADHRAGLAQVVLAYGSSQR